MGGARLSEGDLLNVCLVLPEQPGRDRPAARAADVPAAVSEARVAQAGGEAGAPRARGVEEAVGVGQAALLAEGARLAAVAGQRQVAVEKWRDRLVERERALLRQPQHRHRRVQLGRAAHWHPVVGRQLRARGVVIEARGDGELKRGVVHRHRDRRVPAARAAGGAQCPRFG